MGGRCRWQDSAPGGECTWRGSFPGKRWRKRRKRKRRRKKKRRRRKERWQRAPGCKWPGCVEGRGAARTWHEKGDGCWTLGHGDSPQRTGGGALLLLGRPPRRSHGRGGAAGAAAGDGETDWGRRPRGGSWHCPGDGCRGVAPGSRQAGRAARAGCTWGAGWTRRGRWVGGRSARRRPCNWAGAGLERAEGTGRRSWRLAEMEGRRGSVRGPGVAPCPAPCRGVTGGARSEPAPPSPGSWRRPPRCSAGAGPAGVAGWRRRGGRKAPRPGGQPEG